MYTLSYSPRKLSLRSLLAQFFVHHNPFYLLSALCMIAGCYVLNLALELHAGEVRRLLILIATLQFYELLLLALGLYLIHARGMFRDGRTLLLLEVVFLADLMFLNAEAATCTLQAGLAINAVLFALALGKVLAVMWVLSQRFPVGLYSVAAIQLGALFAVPCLLKFLEHDGFVSSRQFYAIWWVVGLLPVLFEVQRRLCPELHERELSLAMPGLGRLYAILPFASLLAHMGMMHWVYRTPLCGADLSPLAIGLAISIASKAPTVRLPLSNLRLLRVALPLTSLLLASSYPRDLQFNPFASNANYVITPVACAAIGAYLAYVYLFFLRHASYWIAAGAVAAAMILFGPTPSQIAIQIDSAWSRAHEVLAQLLPRTAVQWGVTAVICAFAFLGLGAALSLSKAKPQPAAAARLADEEG